ncbi:MAG: methylated-DNA--[protein]-cysteine S-methyltransferase, partial [Pseudomonadota bacterium]
IDRKALPRELARLQRDQPGGIGIGRPAPTQQLADELAAYFSGACATFKTPLHLHGTPFQREVWSALRTIPAGETRSYAQLAAELGRPTSTRAVARANGANTLALVVPCHRIIGSDGALTGYGGGIWRKQRLIEIERQYAPV